MTIQKSWPLNKGRLVMRLTESCLNGRVEEDEMGMSGEVVG